MAPFHVAPHLTLGFHLLALDAMGQDEEIFVAFERCRLH